MLRDIRIENYRCFKDFTITGLARVNLIVGSNEIGKTNFMEAVYLLVNHDRPESLLSLLTTIENWVQVHPVIQCYAGVRVYNRWYNPA